MSTTLEKTEPEGFIRRHQTKFLVGALVVTTTVAVMARIGLKQHDDFLKEHELYEEFYR